MLYAGTVTQDKEPIRKFRWGILVESLFHDFRFALRGLGRDHRLALAAIFALSLGARDRRDDRDFWRCSQPDVRSLPV